MTAPLRRRHDTGWIRGYLPFTMQCWFVAALQREHPSAGVGSRDSTQEKGPFRVARGKRDGIEILKGGRRHLAEAIFPVLAGLAVVVGFKTVWGFHVSVPLRFCDYDPSLAVQENRSGVNRSETGHVSCHIFRPKCAARRRL